METNTKLATRYAALVAKQEAVVSDLERGELAAAKSNAADVLQKLRDMLEAERAVKH